MLYNTYFVISSWYITEETHLWVCHILAKYEYAASVKVHDKGGPSPSIEISGAYSNL